MYGAHSATEVAVSCEGPAETFVDRALVADRGLQYMYPLAAEEGRRRMDLQNLGALLEVALAPQVVRLVLREGGRRLQQVYDGAACREVGLQRVHLRTHRFHESWQ